MVSSHIIAYFNPSSIGLLTPCLVPAGSFWPTRIKRSLTESSGEEKHFSLLTSLHDFTFLRHLKMVCALSGSCYCGSSDFVSFDDG